jgi:hypothetical protein
VGRYNFYGGHGIAWLAKEFNFLFFVFGVLSFSKQILRFMLSFLGMAQQARGRYQHNYLLFLLFIFANFLKSSVRSGRIMWDLHVGRMDRQAYLFIPLPPGETRLASCAGSICMLTEMAVR